MIIIQKTRAKKNSTHQQITCEGFSYIYLYIYYAAIIIYVIPLLTVLAAL